MASHDAGFSFLLKPSQILSDINRENKVVQDLSIFATSMESLYYIFIPNDRIIFCLGFRKSNI